VKAIGTLKIGVRLGSDAYHPNLTGITLSQSEEKKTVSRKARPNYGPDEPRSEGLRIRESKSTTMPHSWQYRSGRDWITMMPVNSQQDVIFRPLGIGVVLMSKDP
jgi:hypothetical protein